MKIELGSTRPPHIAAMHPIKSPKLMISLHRTRRSDRCFIVGRLYVGYVGLMWTNRLFDLTIWINHWAKGCKPNYTERS